MNQQHSLPKVGIRPAIDGRRMGVRESLEAQTMEMAQATARLISEQLRHPCGTPVECVIADTCIAGMAEAAACEEKFSRSNVGLTITVTPCWCYGSETIDMDPLRPKAIWGFNGTERPGAVYLAAALAAHSQKGIPAFSIYGHDVQDSGDDSIPADVQQKLLRFTRAGLAVAGIKGKSYLSLGGVSMGIAGSIVDHDFFESWLGMKVQAVDMTELRRRIDNHIYDQDELALALEWADAHFRYGPDLNAEQYRRSPEENRRVLRESLLMAICIRDMMQGNPKLAEQGWEEEALGYNAVAAGFQGQRHWTDQYPNGDTAEALLNSAFDWNGVRRPLVVATENDSLNGVAMLFGHMLTGTAQIFADVRTYWSPQAVERVTGQPLQGLAEHGIIHLINSGSAALDGTCRQQDAAGQPTIKPHWQISPREADACLAATEWCPAIHEYFRGGGFSSRFLTRGGVPFTMSRVNLIKGVGPVLQIAEGWSVELPEEMHDILDNRTNATWPTTWFVPRLTGNGPFKDVYSVMANWGANHGVLTIGHVGADLITLASMLRIPVCMHNVTDDAIYRPSAWAAHGMDSEGQDYRACQNYGPLYKRA
ncbi:MULTISPECIES: L-fucose isomerase [Edwardsiella]|uniref:L-fucose isomerase n=2 Tax=Edwardsiella anguillarum TaxID=1821960 RepID=A0A076LIU8_9GAMM|nr:MULTISPECIES: L-fucose isomerase [Edwardsiella]AKM46171.1 sugar isomerase [Edwardsiella sp. EA181011]GAJ67196.1 L-fucose isomerase [Edwardsiella piscicida]AIJ08490.1 L-fucose isomerase [Edwardsiella anguillarum ET080813]AKR76560.1 L-fucose isomerase [Edwardsiella sp. LADL05-105]KAB0593048.1 L-fucose isomerase [Edwardsiella anguillarum]